MRSKALTALAAATIALLWTPVPAQARRAAPAKVCTIRDERLDELSGMVATDGGYVLVNDGSDFAARRKVFFLNSACRITRTVSYPSRPRDTEDLARGTDGTLWIADIGDNSGSRTTVALWKLAPGARSPVLHRLTYPDGAHDAEAVLVTADDVPIIITKEGGTAGLYTPAAALSRSSTTPLKKAGEVTVPLTGTSNPFSFLGRAVITGAATSPDGRHVALRTYADAFEFDVPDSDVLKALTTGTPRPIALPDEPQGEAITYSPDGRSLLTVSESRPAGTRPVILRYPLPDRPAATTTPPPTSESANPAAAPSAAASPNTADRPFNYLAYVVGAIALLAIALAFIVVARARRTRRR